MKCKLRNFYQKLANVLGNGVIFKKAKNEVSLRTFYKKSLLFSVKFCRNAMHRQLTILLQSHTTLLYGLEYSVFKHYLGLGMLRWTIVTMVSTWPCEIVYTCLSYMVGDCRFGHLSVLGFLTASIVQNRQEFMYVLLFALKKTLKFIFLQFFKVKFIPRLFYPTRSTHRVKTLLNCQARHNDLLLFHYLARLTMLNFRFVLRLCLLICRDGWILHHFVGVDWSACL